ncbi:MAG: hypothetical protein P8I94_01490, partial [Emcibacteraceae bacterium]|nr:hypothetical protein [Emcibacteraceae bacterium]
AGKDAMKVMGADRAVVDAVTETTSKMAKALESGKSVVKTMAKTGSVEGITEGAQTMINEIIRSEATDTENQLGGVDVLDAMMRGAVGGTAMGGGAMAGAHSVKAISNRVKKHREAVANGWDTETTEEVSDMPEAAEGFNERLAGVFKSKDHKPSSKQDDSGIAGTGEFDGLKTTEVPNLKSERYNQMRALLEPNGKAVDLKEVGRLIETGQITEAELASYAADNHYGRSTAVTGQFNKESHDNHLVLALEATINASRDGTLKLTDNQIDQLMNAEESGYISDINKALNAINPGIKAAVNATARDFDGKRMFKDYAERNESKRTRDAQAKADAEVKAEKGTPTIEIDESTVGEVGREGQGNVQINERAEAKLKMNREAMAHLENEFDQELEDQGYELDFKTGKGRRKFTQGAETPGRKKHTVQGKKFVTGTKVKPKTKSKESLEQKVERHNAKLRGEESPEMQAEREQLIQEVIENKAYSKVERQRMLNKLQEDADSATQERGRQHIEDKIKGTSPIA